MWQHRFAAIAQDYDGLFVFPIVDDLLQHISAGAGRNGFEKASGYELSAGQITSCTFPCCRDAGRRVEEDAGDGVGGA